MDEAGFYNRDCMEAMKEFPDGFFDLAIVDPPYGIGVFSMTFTKGGKQRNYKANTGFTTKGGKAFTEKRDYSHLSDWDTPPGPEYFDELFRVSQRQIIWGATIFSFHRQSHGSYGTSAATTKCRMILRTVSLPG